MSTYECPSKTKYELVGYSFKKQCAAVRTCFSLKIVPPQVCVKTSFPSRLNFIWIEARNGCFSESRSTLSKIEHKRESNDYYQCQLSSLHQQFGNFVEFDIQKEPDLLQMLNWFWLET